MEIDLHTIVRRNPEMVTSKIDNEIVMMSIEKGEYYGLDETGTYIWEMIETPVTVENLIQNLMNEFEVEMEQCQNDTLEFLKDLYGKGLLIVIPE